LEVPARLVAASVFKTAVPCVNRSAGGFDSHALPFCSLRRAAAALRTYVRCIAVGAGKDLPVGVRRYSQSGGSASSNLRQR